MLERTEPTQSAVVRPLARSLTVSQGKGLTDALAQASGIMESIELFGREVLPGLRGIWDDEGWVNHWWPERLRQRAVPMPAGVAAGG